MQDLIERWRVLADSPDASPAILNRYARLTAGCEPDTLRDPQAALSAAQRLLELESNSAYLETLALALSANQLYPAAVQAQRQALQALQALPPDQTRARNECEERLVEALKRAGDIDGAVALMADVVARRREHWPKGHSEVAVALRLYGDLLIEAQLFEQAREALQECVESQAKRFGDGHTYTESSRFMLGTALLALGRVEEAEALLLRSYRLLRDNPEVTEKKRLAALARVAKFYAALARPLPAERSDSALRPAGDH